MKSSRFFTSRNIAFLAVLLALVIVLQIWASAIPLGATRISLTLIPIVLGAVLLGPAAGAFLGAAFGVVVVVVAVAGGDPFTLTLLSDHPALTVLLCLVNGAAAGAAAGLLFKLGRKKNESAAVFAAANRANLCLALCGSLNSYDCDDVLADIARNYDKYNTMSDRVRYIPGLHAEYTCEEKLLEEVADFAIERGAPTCIHLSETLKEVGDCTVRHGGLTPPQYLHKLGFFENGGIAAHCVYADKDDLDLLHQYGVVPVINSASNLKLASGIPPVSAMLRRGMAPALGTDGTASNNAASMFREMYLFSCLQKQAMKDAAAVSAEQALCAATENGYKALGFRGGSLKKGNFADMVLLDLSAPSMRPQADIGKNIVYSADTSCVLMTMAGGRIVYDRGSYHIGEDISVIYAECEKRQKRLLREALR